MTGIFISAYNRTLLSGIELIMLGKISRVCTSVFPVEVNRSGSCNRCGKCCKLVFKCFFLREDGDGNYSCAAYKFRPPLCRKFPRTQAQLDIVKDSCGYTFSSDISQVDPVFNSKD